MNTEHKQLVEDAAKLLGLGRFYWADRIDVPNYLLVEYSPDRRFNPLDPERGDLMKVVEGARLIVNHKYEVVEAGSHAEYFSHGDYESLALAVLRAASAVLKARGE